MRELGISASAALLEFNLAPSAICREIAMLGFIHVILTRSLQTSATTAPASPLPMRDLDQPAKPEEDELALELTALLVTMSVLE